MDNKEDLKLVFVKPIGENSDGLYEYEFFFSNDPETVWEADWNVLSPSACGEIEPKYDMYQLTERLVTDVNFFCAQQNSCFSMQDCKDGIIAVCFEDLSDLEEYPTPYRIVFKYGEEYNNVIDILNGRELSFI